MLRFRPIWSGLALASFLLAACAPVPFSPATGTPDTPVAEEPLSQPVRGTPQIPPVGTPTPSPARPPAGTTTGEDLPEGVEAAIATFSQTLDTVSADVEVVSYEEVTWPDSCLGLGRPDEMCLQALTPGYLIQLEVGGKPYEVHTDARGASVRIKGEAGPRGILPGVDHPLPILAALRSLSASRGIPMGRIEVVSVEEAEWSNSCLGLPGPQEMCAEVITPGFLVILRAAGEEYEFHTDQTGENLRQK
jgi:hypothetical protein